MCDLKDALGVTLADGLALAPRLEKCLDVATAVLPFRQTQRFAAKQGHGLCFHFANVGRRLLGVCVSGFLSSKMGKCIQIIHFLNFRGISPKYPQPNPLTKRQIKKSVPLVPLVPTVSFSAAKLVVGGCEG